MMHFFQQWNRNVKVVVFLTLCGLFIGGEILIFLMPQVEKLRSMHQHTIALNQQWQQQHLAMIQYQKLQQDMTLLNYNYGARLQALHHPQTFAGIYTAITTVAHSHGLQMLGLKPQNHQVTAYVEQTVFHLEISGAELNVLDFLQLLMHQTWLLEIQQLDLTAQDSHDIHLQAMMAVYYATT